jgi:hypothetical protein
LNSFIVVAAPMMGGTRANTESRMPVSLEPLLATLPQHALALSESPSLIAGGTAPMTSARKRFNNAQNAHACTGPKTATGKARSARNALKHGLNLPVLADPVLAQGVEELARKIAGADAGLEDAAFWQNEARKSNRFNSGVPQQHSVKVREPPRRRSPQAFGKSNPNPGTARMSFCRTTQLG